MLLKQLFDAKLLIWRLPSFRVPKIMAVRHVHLTRVKVATNMVDQISLKDSDRYLKGAKTFLDN